MSHFFLIQLYEWVRNCRKFSPQTRYSYLFIKTIFTRSLRSLVSEIENFRQFRTNEFVFDMTIHRAKIEKLYEGNT
jgi:hypothetical protein